MVLLWYQRPKGGPERRHIVIHGSLARSMVLTMIDLDSTEIDPALGMRTVGDGVIGRGQEPDTSTSTSPSNLNQIRCSRVQNEILEG